MKTVFDKIQRRIRQLLTDRRWWGFFLQRQFRHPKFRSRIARMLGRFFRPSFQFLPDTHGRASHAEALRKECISSLGQLLSPEACITVRNHLMQCAVIDPYRQSHPAFLPLDRGARHPQAHIAHHRPEDVIKAPGFLGIANDKQLLQIAADFLGCKPTIGYMAAWWSYPTGKGAQEAEHFHRDVDDWRFLKLFVYVSDVDQDNGPHVYVRSSATSGKLTRSIRRFDEEEVAEAFGKESIVCLPGKAGSGFMEDTFGIHRGLPVSRGERLIFQVVYSLFPLPYSPLKPVMAIADFESLKLDPWINRIYLR